MQIDLHLVRRDGRTRLSDHDIGGSAAGEGGESYQSGESGEFEHGESQLVDATFEQFVGQSNVRGISDAPHAYTTLRVLRDLGRSSKAEWWRRGIGVLGNLEGGISVLDN